MPWLGKSSICVFGCRLPWAQQKLPAFDVSLFSVAVYKVRLHGGSGMVISCKDTRKLLVALGMLHIILTWAGKSSRR